MDRIALRRAQRALRRPRHVSSLAVALLTMTALAIAVPSIALGWAAPIGIGCALLLVFVALPLGPRGAAASLRHEPSLPE